MQAPSPGQILEREFLKPLGLTVRQLACDLHVPAKQLSEVVSGKRPVRADLALRLGRYFGVKPQNWLAWQAEYDLDQAQTRLGDTIDGIAPVEAA